MKLISLLLVTLIIRFSLFNSLLLVSASFTPIDNYLIACGSSKNLKLHGNTFVPDSTHLKPGSDSVQISSNATSPATSSSSSSIFDSARVFKTTGSFKFPISQKGRHWVRLHFNPIQTLNWDLKASSMSVVTDDFVLLENFTVKIQSLREFSVNVTTEALTLTFIPANGSWAFVNAIEVVSIPDWIFPDQALDVNSLSSFNGISNLAMETVFRLNMGGSLITPENDTLGRFWENDEKYLHVNSSAVSVSVSPASVKYPLTGILTVETAPNLVYSSAQTMGNANVSNNNFNVTWVFDVEPEFEYFIRAHFCDIFSKSLNTLVFDLFVNDDLAIGSFDLSSITGDLDVPLYKDFVSNSSEKGLSRTMTVSVGPDSLADETNAILNGLEVFRVSNEFRSLAGVSSIDRVYPDRARARKGEVGLIVGSAVGAMSALLVFVGLFFFCVMKRRRRRRTKSDVFDENDNNNNRSLTMTTTTTMKTTNSVSFASSNRHGRIFPFQEILDATRKFDETQLLGVGGFGRVYRGTLDDGTKVAVKRGNPRSEQGLSEFRTEIEMLSKLRHRHLVSLIGYCDERSEMILVYEYMANGPLRSHLYGANLPSLTWRQRLEICIGAARGLHYLHTGASQSIIHRDVKTTNILLDENFLAKVADFGLSKAGPAIDQTHVSTAVKGSFGYLDPEYFRRQRLTEKSDVYSFGVVLIEVLCTRPALNPVLPRDQVNIAEWAMTWQRKGMLEQIIDKNLAGKVDAASLRKFGETAEKCLSEHGSDRPSMGDVLWNLEYALQLQEASVAAAAAESLDRSTNHIAGVSIPIPIDASVSVVDSAEPFENSVSMIGGGRAGSTDDDNDAATSTVFSQLVNPRGR